MIYKMKFDRERVTSVFSSVIWVTYKRNTRHNSFGGGLLCPREVAKMSIDSYSRNLDDIKKQARDLLHALQRADAVAVNRNYSIDALADVSGARLGDAQYIIAREHGYSSWQELTEHIQTLSSSGNW
jgi:hypothetical protein